MDCRIVLVRPRDPNNIGAAARAMKNFGFSDLAVVAPYAPTWEEVASAVNAEDVIRSARIVESLAEAVEDRTLVVGTVDPSRGSDPPFAPVDLSRLINDEPGHRIALVFGSEKHGLTNDHLSHCHRILSIPTRPDCPSMNLGQAVAVCCYELSSIQPLTDAPTVQLDPAPAGKIEMAVELALDVLHKSGYILPGKENELRLRLRRRLLRIALTQSDVDRLSGALRKIGHALKRD